MRAITNNIREIRKKNGLNQIELAEKVNVGQSAISQIENEQKNPSAMLLYRIAQALKVSVEELIEPKEAS